MRGALIISTHFRRAAQSNTIQAMNDSHALSKRRCNSWLAIWNISRSSLCTRVGDARITPSIFAYFGARASLGLFLIAFGIRAPVGRQGNAVVDTSVTPPPGVEGSSAATWTFQGRKWKTACPIYFNYWLTFITRKSFNRRKERGPEWVFLGQ